MADGLKLLVARGWCSEAAQETGGNQNSKTGPRLDVQNTFQIFQYGFTDSDLRSRMVEKLPDLYQTS